jgi:cold shock protein
MTTPISGDWPEVCSIFRDNWYEKCRLSLPARKNVQRRCFCRASKDYQKDMARGIVKWFNEKKGFGFIVDPAVNGDIFVHFSAIVTNGFRTLKEGEEVEYELYEDQKGSRARNVVRI